MPTFDQLKVYVWNNKSGLDHPGHASIALYSNDGDFVYISFWPYQSKNRDKKARKSNSGGTSSSSMNVRYEEDKEQIKREANHVFFKNNVKTEKKYSLSIYQKIWEKKNWGLYNVNCCYVVICTLGLIYGENFTGETKFAKVFGLLGFLDPMSLAVKLFESLDDELRPSNFNEFISANLPILNTRDVIHLVKRLDFIEQ